MQMVRVYEFCSIGYQDSTVSTGSKVAEDPRSPQSLGLPETRDLLETRETQYRQRTVVSEVARVAGNT